jgi:hypothetical protein
MSTEMPPMPDFLRRTSNNGEPTMTAAPQQEKNQERNVAPTKEELEHDAVRLHREIDNLEASLSAKKKAVIDPIMHDIAEKKKQLRSVTNKLVTLQIAGRAP